jgi:ferric-dicitrate binding protein FerR (iron transport regulator)
MGSANWKRYTAAAAAVLLLAGGAWFWNRTTSTKKDIAISNVLPPKADVPPGQEGAILTLADGKKIVLDTAGNGALTMQGNARLVKTGKGQLVYNEQPGETQHKTYWNALATPRGRRFQLMLPDGSQVWLNAASSIRYPTSFIGKERKVEVTGEAYFEVAHNAHLPFIVHVSVPAPSGVREQDIQVLGTHFNVNAYRDEAAMKTTLIEGRVSIRLPGNGQPPMILNPGQQAVIPNTPLGVGDVRSDADLDKTVAWKNGYFSFKKDNIETVMKQVERWYDVDVVYEKGITQTFNGTIPGNVNVSTVFQILETTGSVHFKIDGRKITVTK